MKPKILILAAPLRTWAQGAADTLKAIAQDVKADRAIQAMIDDGSVKITEPSICDEAELRRLLRGTGAL